MKTLAIRKMPDDLYEEIRITAVAHGWEIDDTAVWILSEALGIRTAGRPIDIEEPESRRGIMTKPETWA